MNLTVFLFFLCFAGELIPTNTIRRERKAVGIVACRPRRTFIVRDANKEKRVQFAQKCLDEGEEFDDVVFSDEVTIQMGYGGKLAFRRVSAHWQTR